MSETAVSYAALLLADAGIEITSDKLQTVIKAAKGTVEPIWTQVYAKALEGKDLKEVLAGFSAVGAAAPAAGAATAAPAASAASEAAAEPEKEEESDEDLGMGLFD